MLENCPICGRVLQIGKDGERKIRYQPEWEDKFKRGEITLEELNQHSEVYKKRQMVCGTDSIPELDGKPCLNYHGGNMSNPLKVVEEIDLIIT